MNDQISESEICSFILRLWAEGPAEEQDEGCVWRVSLTLIPGGERMGFADLEAAFHYLAQITRMENKKINLSKWVTYSTEEKLPTTKNENVAWASSPPGEQDARATFTEECEEVIYAE